MIVEKRFAELTPTELYGLLKLRVDVFVVEQACPYPELDGRDTEPGTLHVWVPGEDGEVLSCIRVLENGEDRAIGRVATAAGAGAGACRRSWSRAAWSSAPAAPSTSAPRPTWSPGTPGSASSGRARTTSRTASPTSPCACWPPPDPPPGERVGGRQSEPVREVWGSQSASRSSAICCRPAVSPPAVDPVTASRSTITLATCSSTVSSA